jgi:hypothetical protein
MGTFIYKIRLVQLFSTPGAVVTVIHDLPAMGVGA